MTRINKPLNNTLDAYPEGRKDWDYVSMEDYDHDTKELVATSNAIAEKLKRELKETQAMFYAAIATMGKIEVDRLHLISQGNLTIIREQDEYNNKIIFRVAK